MPQQYRAARGLLSAATMLALALWLFRGPMPGMVMDGLLTMTAPGGGATAHAAGPMAAPRVGANPRSGISVGCCPGSSTPPLNPCLPSLSVVRAALEAAPLAPALPRRAAEHHWRPQPIGPPASFVS